MAFSGLEGTGTAVKGSTHRECREHTSIYQGTDRDQLASSNQLRPWVYEGIRLLGKSSSEPEKEMSRLAWGGSSVARKSVKGLVRTGLRITYRGLSRVSGSGHSVRFGTLCHGCARRRCAGR